MSPESPLTILLRRWNDAESELREHWYARHLTARNPRVFQVRGPFSLSDLEGMADRGELAADDEVRHLCGGSWQLASQRMQGTGHLPIVGRGTHAQALSSIPKIVASLQAAHPQTIFQFLTPVTKSDDGATLELLGVTQQGYAIVSMQNDDVKAFSAKNFYTFFA